MIVVLGLNVYYYMTEGVTLFAKMLGQGVENTEEETKRGAEAIEKVLLEPEESKNINKKEDTIESSQINVDIVPLLIINDDPNRVYKGKEAFDILNTLKSEIKQQNKKTNSMKYGTAVHFIEQQDNKKERIELEKR